MNFKAKKRKESPFKGTGKFIEYIRCPVCGKLARAQQIGLDEPHKFEMKRAVKSLGYKKGFLWQAKPYSIIIAERLVIRLKKVIEQLETYIYVSKIVIYEETLCQTKQILNQETVAPLHSVKTQRQEKSLPCRVQSVLKALSKE